MPAILELLQRSLAFTFRHSWPLLAAAVLMMGVRFGLDNALSDLVPSLDASAFTPRTAGIISGFVLLDALVRAIYTAALYHLIWSRLGGGAGGWRPFQERMETAFPKLLLYSTLLNALFLFGPLAWPAVIFLPYVEAVIFFEKKGLGASVKRNLSLLFAQPWPALAVTLLGLAIGQLAPLMLIAAELPESAARIYSPATALLTLPLDVAVVVLYLTLSMGRAPAGFPEFYEEDEL